MLQWISEREFVLLLVNMRMFSSGNGFQYAFDSFSGLICSPMKEKQIWNATHFVKM